MVSVTWTVLGRTNTVGVIVPFFTQASVVQRLQGVVDTRR